MFDLLSILFQFLVSLAKGKTILAAENIALRHQLNVLQRNVKLPALNRWDRLLWVFFSKMCSQKQGQTFYFHGDKETDSGNGNG